MQGTYEGNTSRRTWQRNEEAGQEGDFRGSPGKGASSFSCSGAGRQLLPRSPEGWLSVFPIPSVIGQGPLGAGQEIINAQGLSAQEGKAAPVA